MEVILFEIVPKCTYSMLPINFRLVLSQSAKLAIFLKLYGMQEMKLLFFFFLKKRWNNATLFFFLSVTGSVLKNDIRSSRHTSFNPPNKIYRSMFGLYGNVIILYTESNLLSQLNHSHICGNNIPRTLLTCPPKVTQVDVTTIRTGRESAE